MASSSAVTTNAVAPAISPAQPMAAPMVMRTSSVQGPSSLLRQRSFNRESEDWRCFITIEERFQVRAQIAQAYRNNCPTYENLLATVASIDEELLFAAASRRMDYFKAGIDFDNRVNIKRRALTGQLGGGGIAVLGRQRSIPLGKEGLPASLVPSANDEENTAATLAALSSSGQPNARAGKRKGVTGGPPPANADDSENGHTTKKGR